MVQAADPQLENVPRRFAPPARFVLPPEPGCLDDGRPLAASRGIGIGILIALPLWALIGFSVYLLL